jgi:hypothetical protein
MSDTYVTDPEVLKQLNSSSTDYVKDEDLLKQLNAPEPGGMAPQGYPTGPGASMPSAGGAYNTAKTIVGPAVQGVTNTLGTYAKNPVAALTDLTAGHFGLPPPVASTQITPGIQESYQQVKDWLGKSGKFAPTPAPGAELANAAQISEAIGPEGLAAGMKPGGTFPTEAPPIGGPAAQQGTNFIQNITAKFAPMAKAVAPVLNTIGRVAGPAGLAYNAYQAADYAHQAELGQRLAMGQGQVAQHNFRNLNVPYGTGQSQPSWISGPTTGFNQTLTRDQAQAVLQSNNPRDIAAFGGEQHLRQLAQ